MRRSVSKLHRVVACPISHQLRPDQIRASAIIPVGGGPLYVIGGLYGNKYALDEILRIAGKEKIGPTLVFNGDFNFFNSENESSLLDLNETVRSLGAYATLGNIEQSLIDFASSKGNFDDIDCGCSYPHYVSDDYVTRSNEIVERLVKRLRGSHGHTLVDFLRTLPKFLKFEVEGVKITVLHGDCFSMSGWRFSAESIEPVDERLRKSLVDSNCTDQESLKVNDIPTTSLTDIAGWMAHMDTQVVACTHTCLPVATAVPQISNDGADGILVNNGSAGMPNFADTELCGVITRIAGLDAGAPPEQTSLYHSTALNGLRIDAMAVRYSSDWIKHFSHTWKRGTAAHENYSCRIERGPQNYKISQAVRGGFCVS